VKPIKVVTASPRFRSLFHPVGARGERNDGTIVTNQDDNITLRDILDRAAQGTGLTGSPKPMYFDESDTSPDFSRMEFSDIHSYAQDLKLQIAQNERDKKRLNDQKLRLKTAADIAEAKRQLKEEAATEDPK